jgi:glutamate dehydrogenase
VSRGGGGDRRLPDNAGGETRAADGGGVTSTIENEKSERIQAAQELAGQRSAAAEREPLRRFVAALYRHVPPSDVAARTPADLYGAALALWRFAARRTHGEPKVRVYNPDGAADGWTSPHTIIEIVNDDMPFLVDSVTAAVNESGREVRLVIHPILRVARDAEGALAELDPAQDGLRESWMQIAVNREPDDAERAALAARLEAVLGDVRAAVSDWQGMRRALQGIAAEIERHKPPLPPAEIAEGVAFLRWLDDDNFTYLGFREYVFPGIAADRPDPAARSLGILAPGRYPVFDGLRDLAALPPEVQDFVRRRELLLIAKTERRASVHRAAHMDAIGVRRLNEAGEVVAVRVFVGLFTSVAYSRSPLAIPLLRRKVRRTIERAAFMPEQPRRQERCCTFSRPFRATSCSRSPRTTCTASRSASCTCRSASASRCSVRAMRSNVSCRASSMCRATATTPSARAHGARSWSRPSAASQTAFYTHVSDSPLARVHFIIRIARGAVPRSTSAALEQRLAEAARSWQDRRCARRPDRCARRGGRPRPRRATARLSAAYQASASARRRRSPISPDGAHASPARRDGGAAASTAASRPDEDRILRRFLNLMKATLRTNYFQPDADGPKPYLSFKLDPHGDPELPQAAADVRDLRLLAAGRGRAPARRQGGARRLRWSDRARTSAPRSWA